MTAEAKAWVVKKDEGEWFVGIQNGDEVVTTLFPIRARMFDTQAEANECRDFMQQNIPGQWETVARLDWGASKSLGGAA